MKRITGPCEVCSSNSSKYKCPGCELLSCSLSCSKSHKKRTGCTGKKRITEVPVDQFDDNLVLSDYNLLMEAERLAESSHRMLKSIGGLERRKLPPNMHGAARYRKFRFAFVPGGMSRELKNTTYYCPRRKSILWTIEWRFNSTDIILVDHSVDEHTILSTVITKHLQVGPWKNQLKPFCDTPLSDLKFFLKKKERAAVPLYRQLDISRCLGKQLASTVILEYPVIHVYLPSDTYDFEVERWAFRVKTQEPPSSVQPSSLLSLPGTPLREEEIEEGEVSPTRFLDLRVGMNSAPTGGIRELENVTSMGKITKIEEGEVSPTRFLDLRVGMNSAPTGGIHELENVTCMGKTTKMPRTDFENSKPSSDDVDWYTKIALAASIDIDKQLGDFSDCEMDADDCLVLNGLDDNYGAEETEKSLCFAKRFLLGDEMEEGEISS